MPQTQYQANVTRSILAIEAQHRRTHPAHGYILLKQLQGMLDHVRINYPDDPALAACLIADRFPAILGLTRSILSWGQVVLDCEPDEVPAEGARLCES